MPKRFTATEKWSDKWYRSLAPLNKLAWCYLTDSCDVAGVIELDREHADFCIGGAVSWDAFLALCEGRAEVLSNGRIWLTKFCEFQYGTLSPASKPHQAVIKLLRKNGLLERVPHGVHSTPKEKEKDKDKEKDSSLEEGMQGEKPFDAAFDRFWAAYPPGRKGGKVNAKKAFKKAVKLADCETIIASAAEYASSPVGLGEFVQSPAAWLNGGHWDDDRRAWQRNDNGPPPHKELSPSDLGIEITHEQQ